MRILSILNISKSYGKIEALKALDLEIYSGQVWGILGPNGSGKTTALGIILGIVHPNAGTFEWFDGKYGKQVRTHLGALLETPNFYPYLNADDNLAIIRQIKKSSEKNFDSLLDLVGLRERRATKFAGYSLGMRQRLAIAASMVGNPEVLIFDEPTNGLDPEGIADVRATIMEIASAGKTIIMASHMLDEVEKVCSHVAILRRGKLLTQGPVGLILSGNITIEVQAKDMLKLAALLGEMPEIGKVVRKHSCFELSVAPEFDTESLNHSLMKNGLILTQLVIRKHSLESEFLDIIKQ